MGLHQTEKLLYSIRNNKVKKQTAEWERTLTQQIIEGANIQNIQRFPEKNTKIQTKKLRNG